MRVRIAIAQYGIEPTGDPEARVVAAAAISKAIDAGADIIVLPELAMPGYTVHAQLLQRAAEPADGPTAHEWADLVSARGAIVVGGICERAGDSIFNTAIVVGQSGLLGTYRKLHLFGRERDVFTAGDRGLPIVSTAFGVIGVCVCYDLRFPEVVRLLALRGADIIAVPTAWVTGFDDQKWNAEGMCPQAASAAVQANLSQVAIACASAVGTHAGFEFLGSSVVIGPRGGTLAGPLSATDAGSATADIDLDQLRTARRRADDVDARNDRRTDVYGIRYEGRTL